MILPANQFLISKSDKVIDGFENTTFGNRFFQYSSGTVFYNSSKSDEVEAILLGEIVFPDLPKLDNKEVLAYLINSSVGAENNKGILEKLNKCSGCYCIILKNGNDISVFIDSCGQFELYYNVNNGQLTNNPLLITTREGIPPDWMLRNKLCVHNYCGFKNVKKLRPNHFLDVIRREQIRYFPTVERPVLPVHFDDAVIEIAGVLKKSLKAFSNRQPTVLPITAGYDSRLLLAACPDNGVETFIYRHPNMPLHHVDIQIGKQLAEAKGLPYKIYRYEKDLSSINKALFEQLFLPRMEQAPRVLNGDANYFSKSLILNGNIGEIGRSYFGVNNNVSPSVLSAMLGYKDNMDVCQLMSKWKDGVDIDYSGSDNLLDLFYWEEVKYSPSLRQHFPFLNCITQPSWV